MKIGIIGIGGRTGTMFFEELKDLGEVFGIGHKKEIEELKKGKFFVKRGKEIKRIKGNFILKEEFPANLNFDFLFLTIKNPIKEALEFYYQKIKEKKTKIPILFLSQNGIEASEVALSVLKSIFQSENLPIFRISLLNPVEKIENSQKILISYSLPIKFGLAKISGEISEKEVFSFFKSKNFQVTFFSQKDFKNMEYSKLFLNLIGMATATQSLSIKEGFAKKEIFKEEIMAIQEYKKIVRKIGGRFLNFPGYPVKILSLIFSLPPFILFPFRKIFAKLVEKEREGKSKELDEIEYYNGGVVKLGERLGIPTPINKKILERGKILWKEHLLKG